MPSSVVSVPPAFDAWYAKGTQRDLAQRFQSARELTAALRASVGLTTSADTGRGRMTMPSEAEMPVAARFAQTPSPSIGVQTPERPFNATTGGAGALVNEPTKSQPSTGLLVGATLAALALAGTVAFVVLHSKGHEEAGQTTSAAAPQAPASAPEPRAVVQPQVAPVEPAPAASAEAKPTPPSGAGDLEVVAAERPAEAQPHKTVATAPSRPAKPAAKKPEKPAAAATTKPAQKPRVDFGF
jgi:serine/threonine-protein kinase